MEQNPRKLHLRTYFKALIKLTRVNNLAIIFCTQLITAVFLVGPPAYWDFYLTDSFLWYILASTFFIAAAGYIINDYYDIKIDIINKPQRVVIGRIIKRRTALILNFSLNFIGLAISALAGWKILLFNGFAIFLLWLYSNDLKRRPLIGNITISLLAAMALIVIGLHYKEHIFLCSVYALFAFFSNLMRELVKDMEDMRGDATFGCKTFPIAFGVRKSKNLIILFCVGMVANFTLLYNFFSIWSGLYFIFLVFLPLIYFIAKLMKADTVKDYSHLSTLCKLIMVSGIFSMIII